MATTLETLKKVRDRIADPARWTKGAIARNGITAPLSYAWHEDAEAWCIVGAIHKEANDVDPDVGCRNLLANKVAGAIRKSNGGIDLVNLNDDSRTTHADILHAVDQAIIDGEARA